MPWSSSFLLLLLPFLGRCRGGGGGGISPDGDAWQHLPFHQDAFTFSPASALNRLPEVPQFNEAERLQQALRLLEVHTATAVGLIIELTFRGWWWWWCTGAAPCKGPN